MSVTAWHFWYCNNYIQWIFVLVSRKIIDIYEFITGICFLHLFKTCFPPIQGSVFGELQKPRPQQDVVCWRQRMFTM